MNMLPALLVLASALTLLPIASHAQQPDAVKGALGNKIATPSAAPASSSSLGRLGDQLSLPAIGLAKADNLAGVLTFCVNNNYLGSSGVAEIKDKLMVSLWSQRPPRTASANLGYPDGAKGMIGGGGNNLDLSTIKQQITVNVCEKILEYGKSML